MVNTKSSTISKTAKSRYRVGILLTICLYLSTRTSVSSWTINHPFCHTRNRLLVRTSGTPQQYTDPLATLSSTLQSTNANNNDISNQNNKSLLNTSKIVAKKLWYLPFITLLAGLTPACRIIAESHTSSLPDCPIAHDVDTMLLWPAIGSTSNRGLPPSIFYTPAAAITDTSKYGVDWDLVFKVYISRVEIALVVSIIVFIGCVVLLLKRDD